MIERLNDEIRQRTRVIGISPNPELNIPPQFEPPDRLTGATVPVNESQYSGQQNHRSGNPDPLM